jgi:hypothetical protein
MLDKAAGLLLLALHLDKHEGLRLSVRSADRIRLPMPKPCDRRGTERLVSWWVPDF